MGGARTSIATRVTDSAECSAVSVALCPVEHNSLNSECATTLCHPPKMLVTGQRDSWLTCRTLMHWPAILAAVESSFKHPAEKWLESEEGSLADTVVL